MLDSPSSADHRKRQSTQWRASPYTILAFSRHQTKVLARKYVHFQSQVAAGKGTRLVAARPAAYLQ